MVKGTVTWAALAGASRDGAGGMPGGGGGAGGGGGGGGRGGDRPRRSRTSFIVPSASGPVGPLRSIPLRERGPAGFRDGDQGAGGLPGLPRVPRLPDRTPEAREGQSSASGFDRRATTVRF